MKTNIIHGVVILILIALALLPFAFPQTAMASTVVSSVDAQYSHMRTSFYDQGWLYEFYAGLYYKVSADDGETWSSAISLGSSGSQITVWLESGAHQVHIAALYSGGTIKYRMGNLGADGNISFPYGWQTADTTCFDYGGHGSVRSICVDAAGLPWITFSEWCYAVSSYRSYLYVIGSSTGNGIWTADSTKTNMLASKNSVFTWEEGTAVVVPTTSAVTAIYSLGDVDFLYAKKWVPGSPGAWGSAISSGHEVLGYSTGHKFLSSVGVGDYVCTAFLEETTLNISYMEFSYPSATWSGNYTIYSGANIYSSPTLSYSTDESTFYVAWEMAPTYDHLYLTRGNGTNWLDEFDWLDEPAGLEPLFINTPYKTTSDTMGVFYSTHSPKALNYKALTATLHVDTLIAEDIETTAATLKGNITSLGLGGPTYRGFKLNDTPSDEGATDWHEDGDWDVGVFEHEFTDLEEGDKYYYYAYAGGNYSYDGGTWMQFTTGGSAGGICVTTLDVTNIGDFEATANGEIVSTGGSYLTFRGFQLGYSDTPIWEWAEAGNFTVGTYSHEFTDIEADTIYYVRARAGNDTDVDYGSWVGFITDQADYSDEDSEGNQSGIVPPIPGEPPGWLRPPKDWGNFVEGIPWTFVAFLGLVFLVVVVGFAITKYVKSLGVLFMALGFIIGIFSFWPKGGYLDWWVLFPYILVGWALLQRQRDNPISE